MKKPPESRYFFIHDFPSDNAIPFSQVKRKSEKPHDLQQLEHHWFPSSCQCPMSLKEHAYHLQKRGPGLNGPGKLVHHVRA